MVAGRPTPDDRRLQSRVLRTVAVLPSLATLSNLVCGLGAIYACLLAVFGPPFLGRGKAPALPLFELCGVGHRCGLKRQPGRAMIHHNA